MFAHIFKNAGMQENDDSWRNQNMFQHAHKFDECLEEDSVNILGQAKPGAEKLAEIFYSATCLNLNGIEHCLKKTSKNQVGKLFCQPWHLKFGF